MFKSIISAETFDVKPDEDGHRVGCPKNSTIYNVKHQQAPNYSNLSTCHVGLGS